MLASSDALEGYTSSVATPNVILPRVCRKMGTVIHFLIMLNLPFGIFCTHRECRTYPPVVFAFELLRIESLCA